MKIKTLLYVLSICLVALIQTGCSGAADSKLVGTTEVISPVDYKNGVFYFGAIESRFGNSLSDFIVKHPGLELASIASDGTGSYGSTTGYFVVFRNKGRK